MYNCIKMFVIVHVRDNYVMISAPERALLVVAALIIL